jgi:hypothetical protein
VQSALPESAGKLKFSNMPTRLPYREELFAYEIAAFTPPDRAYLLAGFKSSPQFARANACRLLRKAAVVRRVDELRAEFRERCALNVEYVQALLLPIVECNVLDCFEQKPSSVPDGEGGRRKRKGSTTEAPTPAVSSALRFKALDSLRREQGLAIAGLKLGDDGAVVDVKFHSKNEAARVLLATLGVKDGDDSSGLALVELGSRLGAALARAQGKVIDGKVIDQPASAPPPLSLGEGTSGDDEVVAVIEC